MITDRHFWMTKPHSPDTLLLQSSQARNSSPKHEMWMSLFLHQIWRMCLTMDALQWMGAVRMRVQTRCNRGSIIMDMDYGIWVKMLGLFHLCLLQMLTDGLLWCFYQTLILTAPIHYRASIDSHSDGTHSLQSIHWLSFWRHPFTAEHPLTLILTAPIHCREPLTLILTAPIHCRASIDSHSDGTHSLQSIHWLSFWRHPSLQSIHCWDTFLQTWWRNKLVLSWMMIDWRVGMFSLVVNLPLTTGAACPVSVWLCKRRRGRLNLVQMEYLCGFRLCDWCHLMFVC